MVAFSFFFFFFFEGEKISPNFDLKIYDLDPPTQRIFHGKKNGSNSPDLEGKNKIQIAIFF
jgi:hypothetical protein